MGAWIEKTLDRPGAWGVVHMVGVTCAAKHQPRIEFVRTLASHAHAGVGAAGNVQVMLGDKRAQVGRAQMFPTIALGIGEVKAVDTQLVGHGDVAVVGNAACHPMMPAYGLEPPDLFGVVEGDAVHLVGAVPPRRSTPSRAV